MIFINKNSGCYWENLVPINDDAVLLDIVFPGGITVNTACIYGPSHKDDSDFWDLVVYLCFAIYYNV